MAAGPRPHSGHFTPGKDFLYPRGWLGAGHGLDGCGEQKTPCPIRFRTPNLPACSKLRPRIKSRVMTRVGTSNSTNQNFLEKAISLIWSSHLSCCMEYDGDFDSTALSASGLPQTVRPRSVCRDNGDHRVLEGGTRHLSAADLQAW